MLGKGGSVKTTITAALAKYFSKDKRVLAVDADQNVNLGGTLGIDNSIDLAEHQEEILDFFHKNRDDMKEVPKIGTTPPDFNSNFVKIEDNDPILSKFGVSSGDMILVQAGSYTEKDIGSTCYHGKQEVLEALYHHLLDKEDEVVIADSTAGLDSLGNSLFMVHDVVFYVVEPTLKSTEVFKMFKKIASSRDIRLKAIANKIRSDEDLNFVKEKIGEDPIAVFSDSKHIHDLEKGDHDALSRFIDEFSSQFVAIENYMGSLSKDWDGYYQRLIREHKTISESWYDDYYGVKISEKFNPDFSYVKVIADADKAQDE